MILLFVTLGMTSKASIDVSCRQDEQTVTEWLKSWGNKLAQRTRHWCLTSRKHLRRLTSRTHYCRRYYVHGIRRAKTAAQKQAKALRHRNNKRSYQVSRLNFVTAITQRLFSLTNAQTTDEPFQFDTDSYVIAIDNCSMSSMTCDINDYVKPPIKVNLGIRGLNGNVNTTYKGTVKWKFADNKGMIHEFVLDNVYYCKTLPFRLLSPQH